MAVRGDIVDAGNHVGVRATAIAVENPDGDEYRAWAHSDNADGVVLGADDSRDMAAVAVRIVRRGIADEAAAARDIDIEVGMVEVDAGIDDPGRSASRTGIRSALHALDAPWKGLRGRLRGGPAKHPEIERPVLDRFDFLVLLAKSDCGVVPLHVGRTIGRHRRRKAVDGVLVDVFDASAGRLCRANCLCPRIGDRAMFEDADITAGDLVARLGLSAAAHGNQSTSEHHATQQN